MKKKVTYLIIVGLICSCGALNKSNTFKDNDKIIGLWTEHWDNDPLHPETDVRSVDTLKVDIKGSGKIKIICVNNSNYVYSNITYNVPLLSFQMENKRDPKEKFIIHYFLILTEENVFSGEIINSRGQKGSVKLKKHIKSTL